jgi:hypothetical protein
MNMNCDYEDCDVSLLLGMTLSSAATNADEELVFVTTEGREFRMYHSQNCCEYVTIEDTCGELTDLIGVPILMAEKITNEDNLPGRDDMELWTFYKFATIKGYVTIRWYGGSNGYYSVSVDFAEMVPREKVMA